MTIDVLSFLDESQSPSNDVLDFLDIPEQTTHEKLGIKKKDPNLPIKPTKKDILGIPQGQTIQEKFNDVLAFSQGIKRALQFGIPDKLDEALGLPTSEEIWGQRETESEQGSYSAGKLVGSALPVEKIYSFLGKPLVALASQSPMYAKGLEAFARMTGMGLTGAVYEGTGKLNEGEVPTVEELATTAGEWALLDGAFQTLHLGAEINASLSRIAEQEGITVKDVLGRLWDSTKNYLKLKLGRPVNAEVVPEDAVALFDKAKYAEQHGIKEAETIDIPNKQIEQKIPEEPVESVKEEPTPPPVEPEKPIDELDSLKKELSNLNETQGKVATNEKSELIKKINEIELDRYNKEKEIASKPKKVTEKPESTSNKIYRGHGRATKHVGGYSGIPVLGEGKYYAFDRKTASEYGPEIESKELDLKNPLIINSDQQWRDYAKKSGWDVPNPTGKSKEQIKEMTDRFQEQLKKDGYDGAIIEWDNTTKYDIDKNNNDIKLLRNVFKTPQVFYPETKVEPAKIKKQPTPKPLASKPATFFHPKTQPRKPVIGKKQAVARSKITELLRKAFKDPVRLGKIGNKRAQGIHKMWARVTRLLKDNDIETLAHEIGHNLHTILYGGNATTAQQQMQNVIRALTPHLGELKPLAGYAPFTLEGFAEFTRLYVTNPDVAIDLAPNFYAKFESDLDAMFPELKNALLEARDYYESYLQGTPESRIRAQTNYGSDENKFWNSIKAIKENGIDKLLTTFYDDMFPAKRLVAEAFGIPISEVEALKDPDNLYRSLRLLKGAVGKGDVFISHETFDPLTLNKINGSLKSILDQVKDEASYREFNDYLIARRTIEKAGQNVETGINLGDAVYTEQKLHKQYNKLAKELDHYNDTLLKYAKESGMLSQEQYSEIKKNNLMYAPFQRVVEKPSSAVRKGLQAQKTIKHMKGSTRDIIAPIESVLQNTYAIIMNAEKNLSGQTLARIAQKKGVGSYVEAVPTPITLKGKVLGEEVEETIAKNLMKMGLPDLVVAKIINGKASFGLRADLAQSIPDVFLRFGATHYPVGENIITVYFDGKPKYYEVSPDIYNMWTAGLDPYMSNIFTKIARIPARTLRAGAILNPRFWQKNVIRDTWESWLFTKYGKPLYTPQGILELFYDPLKMLAVSAKHGDLYVKWLKAGGGMSTMQHLDRPSVVKRLDEVRHGIRPYQVMKQLRALAEISEEANRLAEFGRALHVEGSTRVGMEMAGFASRDISVDFAKIGTLTKAINQIIPFFNATLQGGEKLIRTAMNKKSRNDFIPRAIMLLALPSLMIAWYNKDDDRIPEFSEVEKDSNFMFGWGDKIYKIPVPFETGVIIHGLTQRMYKYFMEHDPKAFEGLMGSIIDAALPNFIPTFALAPIEVTANKKFFNDSRIIPMAQEKLISKLQYREQTSMTARLLGRCVNYMIGEDTTSKWASPIVIEHYWKSATGGLGLLALKLADEGLHMAGVGDKAQPPHQTVTEKLGLNAFEAKYPRSNTRSIEKFYNYYEQATALQRSSKYAKKHDIEQGKEEYEIDKRLSQSHDISTLQKAYEALQTNQKTINDIYNNPDIDPLFKRELIDQLYLQNIDIAKHANREQELFKHSNK